MLRLSETDAFARHMGSYLDWYRRKRAAEDTGPGRRSTGRDRLTLPVDGNAATL